MKVSLEKILWGGEQGISGNVYSLKTHNYLRSSTLLKDTPHVKLLQTYQKVGKRLFEAGCYQNTPYYHNILECIQHCGNYFNVADAKNAAQQIHRFIDHYEGKESRHIYHQSDKKDPLVAPNAFSSFYEVVDGIHRLAILYVKGEREANCRMSSQQAVTFLQELVLANLWTPEQKLLYQPIESPEFEQFILVRKCFDRFRLMQEFLESLKTELKRWQYLDLGCSYGYFMKKMEALGMTAYGVDSCPSSIQLAKICYHQPEERLRCLSVENFFELNEQKYEVVSLLSVLHHFLLNRGQITAKQLIKEVDQITEKVLFLDSGQNHEEWFKRSLPDWNEKTLIKWLKENTSFGEIFALGKDEDNTGVYASNYGRSLIVCLKH